MEQIQVKIFPDGRMDSANASKYLGLTVGSLATMRSNGLGPEFIKKGKIFYYIDDLNEWLGSNGKQNSTTSRKQKAPKLMRK